MISLMSIQDVRGHGLPGTPITRVRERLRRGVTTAEAMGDTALGRDLDRLAARLDRVRRRGGDLALVGLSPEIDRLLRARARRGIRTVLPERKRA